MNFNCYHGEKAAGDITNHISCAHYCECVEMIWESSVCTPEVQQLRMYISGRPLIPMLQLLCNANVHYPHSQMKLLYLSIVTCYISFWT